MNGGIDQFADDFLYELMSERPDIAANLGLRSVGSRRLPGDGLPDFSDEGATRARALMEDWSAKFKGLNKSDLSPEQYITAQTLSHIFDVGIYSSFPGSTAPPCIDPHPITHLSGAHIETSLMLIRDSDVGNSEDAAAYIEKLKNFPKVIVGAVEALKARRAKDIVAPAVTLEKTLHDIEVFLVEPYTDNALYRALGTRLMAASMEHNRQTSYLQDAAETLESQIYPAYGLLVEELKTHLNRNVDSLGVSYLPDGEAFYDWRLRSNTTTDLTASQIHDIGLDEIERVQDQIRQLCSSEGISGTTLQDLFAKAQQKFQSAKEPPARNEVVKTLESMSETAQEKARPYFSLWPNAGLKIEPIGAELEDSLHAHYVPPTSNRSEGVFFVNLTHAASSAPGDLDIVCYHEGFPGHHVQLALAQELTDLPAFRRNMLFAAYLEGWAKYAENLTEHCGLINEPFLKLARLRSELYSTTNLALDTGIHTKGWSQAKAKDFFLTNTASTAALAEIIAVRSLATPGHVCAYKLGLLKVRELHEHFKKTRGSDYRIQDFHDSILKHGALPLSVLDRVVRADAAVGSA